jgi:hypothetical protein
MGHNKGRWARLGKWARLGRWARLGKKVRYIDVATLTTTIFVADTNVHNKTGSARH